MEDDDMLTCSNCSCEVSVDDVVHDSSIPDTMYCGDCFRICERCDDIGSVDDEWHVVDSSIWCESCTDYSASWCDYCEEYSTGSNYYVSDRDGGYCENCIGNATYCEYCDEYNMDGCDCESGNVVHDYSYRPDPIFHSIKPDDRLFFGIEIEVENPRNEGYQHRVEAAQYAQSHLEDIDLAYLKNDGSLSDGFEIVTHPMTHEFFMQEAPEFWNTLEHLRTNMRMRSWDTSTCGLHVHVSRAGFKGGAHMHRFLNLIYSNEELYSKLAGRSSSRWAKFDDVDQAKHDGTHDEFGTRNYVRYRSYRDKIERGRVTDRYSAVNTQNVHTLEMRIFRGSINTRTVKSAISLAHASVEYTRNLTVKDVIEGALDSTRFMQYIDANASVYPDLVTRLDMLVPERNQVTI
jgi:hypothetical protein